MRITVKISDIEIVVDRPEYKEAASISQDLDIMKQTILPTLKEATNAALELYNNRLEKFKQDQ
jgi:hypothetical protein